MIRRRTVDHTLILQMSGIMTIKNEFINPDTALFEGKFKRLSNWITVSEKAGLWLKETIEENFSSFSLYFFISDSHPIENNRLNKYFKMLNRKITKDNKFSEFKIICDDFKEEENGIIFYSLLRVDISLIANVINYCRSERRSFMIISNNDNLCNFPYDEIIKRRITNKYENIDSKDFINFLVKKNLYLLGFGEISMICFYFVKCMETLEGSIPIDLLN